jgi:tRNA pseudouridine32 synthase/23S rRNA pseudouridine746 synthase
MHSMDIYTFPQPNYFTAFKSTEIPTSIPEQFTFPFYYSPDALSILAAEKVQQYIANEAQWNHNFGLNQEQEGMAIGKMFGVLIVKNPEGVLGFLAAFSGKLANENDHLGFVPPVYDMLTQENYFLKEINELNSINASITALEENTDHIKAQKHFQSVKETITEKLEIAKLEAKQNKKLRAQRRKEQLTLLAPNAYEEFRIQLIKESYRDQHELRLLQESCEILLQNALEPLIITTNKIEALKELRKNKSAALQQWLFGQYNFLNIKGEYKNVCDIFAPTNLEKPPAGAGECATPKLLQYAFQHQMTPIAMAEFWWGKSPASEIRKHQQFYPACRGKCEPILAHMLKGIDVAPNPMLSQEQLGDAITTLYEDDYLLVINKPAEFLSVPGKNLQDSVQHQMALRYPNATGPLLVHRLDMSTSGILLVAKNKEVHENLQAQFVKRTVTKRYVALLEAIIEEDEGTINLPLRVDLDNRPHQLVCYEHGKKAVTNWKVIERNAGTTRVHFYPITGRTHQLRVHAAHALGLNSPIVGDELYGNKANRLHLHAEFLAFTHPINKEIIKIQVDPDF